MNLILRNCIFFILSFFFMGCSYFPKRDVIVEGYSRTKMETALSAAEKLLEEQKYQEAQEQFNDFLKEYPHGVFDLRAKVGLARTYTGLEGWTESLKILQQVTEAAVSENQNQFVGLSAYYSSLNYEALGEEPRTLACLKDAERFADLLPIEIAKAEIPARFAVYYNRHGEYKEAQKYFHQAEKGIAIFFQKNKELSAKNYFQMGFVSTGQVSTENLSAVLSTLELMQIFSLRAIEVEDNNWSPLALRSLKANYRDVWNAIQQAPRNKTLDPFAAEEEQKEIQFKSTGQMLDVIQKMKSFQRSQYENHPLEKDLYSFFDEIEQHAQKMMETLAMRSRLTPESQQRQKLHKEGTIR